MSAKKKLVKLIAGKKISHLSKICHFLPANFEKLMKIHFVFFSNQVLFEIKINN